MTINTENSTDDNYARITLPGSGCPFLAEGLCSIQKKLGEEYLSIMCSAYPRVMNVVDDVLQRSLDLSCPEAARIVLLDPNPMRFDEDEGAAHDPRLGSLSVSTVRQRAVPTNPTSIFGRFEASSFGSCNTARIRLWKRLVILGSLCDQLQEMAAAGENSQSSGSVWKPIATAWSAACSTEALNSHVAQPAKQLELVLELIVGRISSDFTAPRLLSCYQKFMQAMEWTAESSMTDIGRRYAAADAQYYEPFMSRHAHMLEHYLVSYVHRTLFPLGPQESTRGLSVHHIANTIRDQCLLMMVYYAIVQTLLIGMAAYHKEQFGTVEAIQVIQSFTKAFEHSTSFPERALKILAEKDEEAAPPWRY